MQWETGDDRSRTPHASERPKHVTEEQARSIAVAIGLDIGSSEFGIDAFRRGIDVELEHGSRDPETNVTNDDPEMTGKIAWAHLKELPDYYERLEAMEAAGDRANEVADEPTAMS